MDDETLSSAIASGLRVIRAGRRLTQGQLADLLKWPRTTITDLENGRRRVSVEDLETICVSLGVSLAELLMFSERGQDAIKRLGLTAERNELAHRYSVVPRIPRRE